MLISGNFMQYANVYVIIREYYGHGANVLPTYRNSTDDCIYTEIRLKGHISWYIIYNNTLAFDNW